MKKAFLPHVDEFLMDLSNNNYSLQTIKNYHRDLAIFKQFLVSKNAKFREISKKTITLYKGFLKSGEYFQFLEGIDTDPHSDGDNRKSSPKAPRMRRKPQGGLSSRSINRMLSALRSYLRFLVDFDYRSPLAPDAIKLIKTERKESQVAEFDDLVKLVEFPSTFETKYFVALRNRAIMELLFSTGMRISELVSLNIEDLDVTADRKKIRRGRIYIMGKGKKQRFVYLTERCKKHLEEYLSSRNDIFPALFIPTRGTRASTKDPATVRLSVRYIQNRIALYRRMLGIIVPTSAHSLRHGFATYLAEQGANPAAIQRLLGHESLQTTTRYVHASDKFAEEAHRKFHPLKEK